MITLRREKTFKWDKEDELSFSFYFTDGKKVPRSFTPLTDPKEVEKFLASLIPLEAECRALSDAADAARERNHKLLESGGKGRNWPEFGRLDKFLDRLQKESGIQDS